MHQLSLAKLILVASLASSSHSVLVWNTKGEAALFISIAIPIETPASQHVFLSYNFEASYKLPPTWHHKPPIYRRGNDTHLEGHDPLADFEDYYDDYGEHETHKPPPHRRKKPHKNKKKKKKQHKPKPKPKPKPDYQDFFEGYPRQSSDKDVALARYQEQQTLLSRTKFYHILSQRFQQHGFGQGDDCLLRLICEANSAQLADHNGVLGSLIHVMFSPSSSKYEALPQRYYHSESIGKREGNCDPYKQKCDRSLLELITRPLADYIGNKKI